MHFLDADPQIRLIKLAMLLGIVAGWATFVAVFLL